MYISAIGASGRRLVHLAGVSCFMAWPCLKAALAARLDCDDAAIALREEADGTETLLVCGVAIGTVTSGSGSGRRPAHAQAE